MGSIGGSSCKTTSIKCAMARVTVEAMCVLPKTEPGHPPIYLPQTSLWSGAEACRNPPKEKGVINTGKKVYRPPLPSTYKETELSEDLNDGM